MGSIVRHYSFNCIMYVRSQKFGYMGHWLSDVNTLEMKNFDTHLFFICNTNYKSNYIYFSYAILITNLITNQKFQRNPKMLTFDFSGLQISLRPGKVPFATMQNIRLAR